MNTYFGAAVLAVDLNHDGLSDLLVGAPLYSQIQDEGRVYIFMNQGRVRLSPSLFVVFNIKIYLFTPRKFKEGICCGGHLAVTYGGELLYLRIFLKLNPPSNFVSCLSCVDLNHSHI